MSSNFSQNDGTIKDFEDFQKLNYISNNEDHIQS